MVSQHQPGTGYVIAKLWSRWLSIYEVQCPLFAYWLELFKILHPFSTHDFRFGWRCVDLTKSCGWPIKFADYFASVNVAASVAYWFIFRCVLYLIHLFLWSVCWMDGNMILHFLPSSVFAKHGYWLICLKAMHALVPVSFFCSGSGTPAHCQSAFLFVLHFRGRECPHFPDQPPFAILWHHPLGSFAVAAPCPAYQSAVRLFLEFSLLSLVIIYNFL